MALCCKEDGVHGKAAMMELLECVWVVLACLGLIMVVESDG